MNYCFVSIAFFLWYYHSSLEGANAIDCKAKALRLKDVTHTLDGFTGVTIKYIGKPHFTYFTNGFSKTTSSYSIDENDDSDNAEDELTILVQNPKNPIRAKENETPVRRYILDMNKEYAIFKLNRHRDECHQGSEDHVTSLGEKVFYPDKSAFSFALIHVSKDEDFLIFQACDKSYAWVDLNKNVVDSIEVGKEIRKALKSLRLDGPTEYILY